MSDYIDLEDSIVGTYIVPGWTITERRFQKSLEATMAWAGEYAAKSFLEDLGVTITPDHDPKLTNAEKLEATLLDRPGLRESLGNRGVHALAVELDREGVKAQGEA